MIPEWTRQYVGVPWRERGRDIRTGVDCWGLVRAIMAEQDGILLPEYAERYDEVAPSQVAGVIRAEMHQFEYLPCEEARRGDVLLIRALGQPMHIAYVIDQVWMLHIQKGRSSVLDRWQTPRWLPRLSPEPYGAYRYRAS